MKVTSISHLKDHLSAHMERVRSGDSVLVTDRKRPVALLSPIRPADLSLDMQQLLTDGTVLPGSGKMSVDAFLALPKARIGKGITSATIEERDES